MNDNEGTIPQQIAHLEATAGTMPEHLKVRLEEPRQGRGRSLEFESRDAELTSLGPDARAEARRNFEAEFSKLELPDLAAATKAIARITQLAAYGQERYRSAQSGRSDPIARMTAARMAAA
jgi:hypothetical protein